MHDRTFHRDIFCSSYTNRLRHLVFHFAKYVGRLAELTPHADAHLQRTLAATFIISLSAADLLNIRLAAESLVPNGYHGSISDLSEHLAKNQKSAHEGWRSLVFSRTRNGCWTNGKSM